MAKATSISTAALGLRAGDWVEVKSITDILATLDDRGRLDALPFMPEMLQYCGGRFRVYKSAHKTCDRIENTSIPRRMTHTVHLDGLRCDGAAHGGCQAGCLIYWKEAWLKRVPAPRRQEGPKAASSDSVPSIDSGTGVRCDLETLNRETRAPVPDGAASEERYSCQATEMLQASVPSRWWSPGPYLKDLASGNVRLDVMIRYMLLAAYNCVVRQITKLNWRGAVFVWPYIQGLGGEKTPTVELNLQPGELVRVRSRHDIMLTLNRNWKNRGLSFDVEMVPYCGKTYRVLRRVDKNIDERSGKMLYMRGPCLILDGVICSGCLSRNRLFCPKSIYPYWHEIWLERVESAEKSD